ncbi:MAG: UDP-N-acetylglucosamine 1-carboxyvinyltransferase, partial [Bacteroidota bacterium]|nr:UDP-N-acetylglucosamine 1-carboxyvinyltransferase [Bacteroidota bacterium]
MGTFVVEGGRPLSGTIEPQGAKNEALQILCAVLLTAEPVEITNVPDIVDINKLLQILEALGVRLQKKSDNHYVFQADQINLDYLKSDDFKSDGRK